MDQLIEDYKALGYTNVSEVQTSSGTGYYMVNKYGSGSVYLPPNATSADALVGLHPGSSNPAAGESQSGNANYRFYINDTIKTGNAPEGTIFVMANNMNDYKSQPNAVNVAMDNGVPLTNVGVMDYSYSGRTGMLAAGEVSAAHPELEVRVANIDASMLDAYNQGVYRELHQDGWNSEAVQANLHNNVTVVSVVPENDYPGYENAVKIKQAITQMGADGHNSYMISSSSKLHEVFHTDFVGAGGIEWLAGKGNLESDKYVKVQKYDSSTNSWVDSDVNELRRSISSAQSTLSSVVRDDGVMVKYASVLNSLNGIVGNINTTNFADSSLNVNGANSTAQIFGSLTGANNYLLGLSSTLVNGIANDVRNIETILNNWESTDADIATLASSLNNASYSANYGANGISMNNVRFNEIATSYAGFLSGSTAQGKVGKISMSDIKSVFNGSSLTGSLGNLLNNEIQDAHNLQSSIQGLINNPDISSPGWNVMLDRLNFYDKCCGVRGWAAETMKTAYEKALKLIYDHIAPDEDMDDGDIPEYEEKIEKLKTDIENAKTMITNLKNSNITLSNVKPTAKYGKTSKGKSYFAGWDYTAYNQARRQIASNNAKITQLEKNVTIAEDAKLEAEKYLKRLKELSEKINEANNIISEAMTEIESKYGKEVYNIDTPRVQARASGVSAKSLSSTVSTTGATHTPIAYSQLGYYKDGKWVANGWDKAIDWRSVDGNPISTAGCQLTSTASAMATLLNDATINPVTIAEIVGNRSNRSDEAIMRVAEYYGLDATDKIGMSNSQRDQFLENGGTVLFTVNNGGHWEALLGKDENGNYVVCDPNSSTPAIVTSSLSAAGIYPSGMTVYIAPKGKTVDETLNGTARVVRLSGSNAAINPTFTTITNPSYTSSVSSTGRTVTSSASYGAASVSAARSVSSSPSSTYVGGSSYTPSSSSTVTTTPPTSSTVRDVVVDSKITTTTPTTSTTVSSGTTTKPSTSSSTTTTKPSNTSTTNTGTSNKNDTYVNPTIDNTRNNNTNNGRDVVNEVKPSTNKPTTQNNSSSSSNLNNETRPTQNNVGTKTENNITSSKNESRVETKPGNSTVTQNIETKDGVSTPINETKDGTNVSDITVNETKDNIILPEDKITFGEEKPIVIEKNDTVTSTVSNEIATNTQTKNDNKSNNIATAAFAAAGIGLAAGAVAYGVKETRKEKEEENSVEYEENKEIEDDKYTEETAFSE